MVYYVNYKQKKPFPRAVHVFLNLQDCLSKRQRSFGPRMSRFASAPRTRGRTMALLWAFLSVPVASTAMPSLSRSEFACEPIALRMCQGLPYNTTFTPNLLQHHDQQSAELAMESFHPMLKLRCSPDLRPFLCALHAPVCVEYGRVSLPCRPLCQRARRDCQPLLHMFGVRWPEEMECNRFPSCEESYPRAEDLLAATDPTDSSPASERRDYGFWCPRELKVEPDLGYVFLGARDCSPPCPNMYLGREELRYARYAIGATSVVCLSATLFAVLTFLIDVTRFRYPERPIVFYAVCHAAVSLVYLLGFLLEDRVACNPGRPAQGRASTVTQGSHSRPCTLLFMALYFFTAAGRAWWVVLTVTWFLAAVPKWGSEAIEKKAPLFHAGAWGIPGTLTVVLLARNKIEGDNVSGVCFVGLYDADALRWFVLVPLGLAVLAGSALLLAGIAALNRARTEIPLEKENRDKLVKFMVRIGTFSALYLAPLLGVIGCHVYEQSYRSAWETTWVREHCQEYHIPCPAQVEHARRPDLLLFLMKYLLGLVLGIPSLFWVGSKKTCFEWAGFFHGRQRKDSAVEESRSTLREPDFSQLLLTEPQGPVTRKSRGTSTQGTSTQGTSTHASSTQLAPPNGQHSRASSVHSKVSNRHGNLHHAREDRFTPCSYREVEERLRLNDQSQSLHGSALRLDGRSPHASARDLNATLSATPSATPSTRVPPGSATHRAIGRNGAST